MSKSIAESMSENTDRKSVIQKSIQIIEEIILKNNSIELYTGQYNIDDSVLEELCGEEMTMWLTKEILEDKYQRYIVKNNDGKIVSISVSYKKNENNNIYTSEYVCSSVRGLGELMQYYNFLKYSLENDNISFLGGKAVGGIPALNNDDTDAEIQKKKIKLYEYHEKRGADFNRKDESFMYSLDTIISNIVLIHERASKSKKKRKSRKSKRSRKSRKRSRSKKKRQKKYVQRNK